jgi:hypothetical protein
MSFVSVLDHFRAHDPKEGRVTKVKHVVVAAIVLFGYLVLAPGAAQAQSAFAGVVKDTSGAVLPGVTVEASSDVLIEKTRSVVTNGQGQYTIVDLRPGVYSLSFTLPGSACSSATGLSCPPTSPRPSTPT